jgi:hypothetical protein
MKAKYIPVFILGVRNNYLTVAYRQPSNRWADRRIKSVKDFMGFLQRMIRKHKIKEEELIVMGSSSMDFPKDSTKNKETLKLVEEFNSLSDQA